MNKKEKQVILQRLKEAQRVGGYTLNITLPAAMEFIRTAGKYDFFINEFTGEQKALYIRLYNQSGFFFDNHLWGFYSDKQIAEIFYNIISEIKQP
jgi:chitinase